MKPLNAPVQHQPQQGCFGRILSLLMLAVVIYGAWIGYLIYDGLSADDRRKSDAIVVLGAAQYNGTPSPVLRARLDHAVQLYRDGVAPRIVVTGGAVPGDSNTEASASAAYLSSKGVPDANILREVQGRNSWESLQASAVFMQKRGINSVVLVSDPFHNARIEAMAEDLGLNPVVSPTRTSPITGDDRLPYLVKEWIHLFLGKALGFALVGDIEKSFTTGSISR